MGRTKHFGPTLTENEIASYYASTKLRRQIFFSCKSEKKNQIFCPMFFCLAHSPVPQITESTKHGKNSHISRFGKISDKVTLFQKYLAIYHFFSTRVPQNRVLNSTRIQ